jgi:hypothetical protein
MKKLLFLLLGILMIPFAGYCIEVPLLAAVDVIEVPGFDLSTAFASIGSVVGLVILITEFIKKHIKVEGGIYQLFSWLVGIILCLIGWFLKLGIFQGIEWYETVAYGLGVGLVANGIFDIEIVKALLKAIFKTERLV